MTRAKEFDDIMHLIDSTISPKYLNKTQETVLREVWNGKTYTKIAIDHNYEPEYIKTVGCNLWKTLSDSFSEQINKNNFVPFMRRKVNSLMENKYSPAKNNLTNVNSNKSVRRGKYHWNTAPNTDIFWGREKERQLLESWSQKAECQCIVISGMVGSGKTSLVAKFSKNVLEQYDYVIGYSLCNPPPLRSLICNYLNIISSNKINLELENYSNVSILISQLIDCLKEKKVLLIIDGLENVLDINKNIYYKKEFEEYAQLIRSIISTDHQSLLVCTTQVVHKSFRYYSSEYMKLMEIGGLCNTSIEKNCARNIYPSIDPNLLLEVYNSVDNNPEIINILNKNLHIIDIIEEKEDLDLLLHELTYLDEIVALLEKEIKYLLDNEREIMYWLSIFPSFVSIEKLSAHLELSKPKFQLAQNLSYLKKRNLIIEQKSQFSLMPIIKSYLRKKVIHQSLNISN